MISLSEEDKKHIAATKGGFAARGVLDHLYVLRRSFGDNVEEKIQKEVDSLGCDIQISQIKEGEKIPASFYMTFLIIEKELFRLDDEGIRRIGKDSAKRSFLLRFASSFLVSMEMLGKHANSGWRKYYDEGTLVVKDLDMKEKKAVGELTDFVGHPVHCRYLEGYFSQLVFFVTGRKAICREEKCMFEGGEDRIHRFLIKWE